METKQEVTKKFIIGIVLIIASLVLGKVALIPIIVFPGDKTWGMIALVTYVFSWLIIVIGVLLAGVEGYRLATHKYKEYQRKTVDKVKDHGRKAVQHTGNAVRKVKEHGKNAVHHGKRAAKQTANVIKHPVKQGRRTAKKTLRRLKIPVKRRIKKKRVM